MILIDTYTKMLMALPSDCPLFKELKIKRGDQVIFKNEVYLITKQTDDYNLAVSEDYKTIRVPLEEYRFWGFCPIVSQEQLQNICLANNPQRWAQDINISDLHALFFNFRTWIQEDDEDSWWDFRDDIEDFRQAWLMFTMETVYDLVWDGEKFQ